MRPSSARSLLATLALLPAGHLAAQGTPAPADSFPCPSCAEWNAPQAPLRIYGNSYYVGTHGLSAILIRGDSGDVLIDGGLPQSAPLILEHLRTLGVRPWDVRLILNSHVHWDHAGGIAALQQATGARVAARAASAAVLRTGAVAADDPQHGVIPPFTPVANVAVVADGETMHVGPLALTAHATAGHTRGGTTWTWRSCEQGRCLDLVYADSQTPISADDFLFTHNSVYPDAVQDFRRGIAVLESLPCDILLTPHPGASHFWERVAQRDSGNVSALVEPGACRRYAAAARAAVDARVAKEQQGVR